MPKGTSNKTMLSLLEVLEWAKDKKDFSNVDGRSLRPANGAPRVGHPAYIAALKARRGDTPTIRRFGLTVEGRAQLKTLKADGSKAVKTAKTQVKTRQKVAKIKKAAKREKKAA